MSVDSVTIGTLVSRVAFHMANTATAETALANEIKFALDRTLRAMVREARPLAFVVEGTISASSGSGATYALADDVYELIYPSVRHASSPYEPLTMLTQQQYDNSSLSLLLTASGRPRHAMLVKRSASTGAWQLRLFPTPDASYTINYNYLGFPTQITSATDDATQLDYRFPRDLVDGLIHGAALMFPQYLGADQRQTFEMLYRAAVADLRKSSSGMDGAFYQRNPYQLPGNAQGEAWPSSIYTGSPVGR